PARRSDYVLAAPPRPHPLPTRRSSDLVETVTGGASAAYGTDAVAGVVNFILDTDFEGVRADLQTGQNEKGHNETIKASFGAGFKDRKSTRLHSSHVKTSYAGFCSQKTT